MKKYFAVLVAFLLLLLSGCSLEAASSSSPSASPSDVFEDVFEPEESPLTSAFSSASSSASAEPAPTLSPSLHPSPSPTPVSSKSSVADPEQVFWVPNGKVYHSTKSCDSLSRSKTIKSGSVGEAKAAGKSRGCKRCF